MSNRSLTGMIVILFLVLVTVVLSSNRSVSAVVSKCGNFFSSLVE